MTNLDHFANIYYTIYLGLHNIQQHIKLQTQLHSQKIKFSYSLCHLYKIDLYGSLLVLIPSNICLKLKTSMNNNNPKTTHIALTCPSPLPLPPESPLVMSNSATQWPCYILFDKVQLLTNTIDNKNKPNNSSEHSICIVIHLKNP
jgi:hypothetical protein